MRKLDKKEEALAEFLGFLLDLHRLDRCGMNDSAEAEELRDRMDGPWYNMTQAEQDIADDISIELYKIKEDK